MGHRVGCVATNQHELWPVEFEPRADDAALGLWQPEEGRRLGLADARLHAEGPLERRAVEEAGEATLQLAQQLRAWHGHDVIVQQAE